MSVIFESKSVVRIPYSSIGLAPLLSFPSDLRNLSLKYKTRPVYLRQQYWDSNTYCIFVIILLSRSDSFHVLYALPITSYDRLFCMKNSRKPWVRFTTFQILQFLALNYTMIQAWQSWPSWINFGLHLCEFYSHFNDKSTLKTMVSFKCFYVMFSGYFQSN